MFSLYAGRPSLGLGTIASMTQTISAPELAPASMQVYSATFSDLEQAVPPTDDLALAMHLTGRCRLEWACGRESFRAHPIRNALTLIPPGRSGVFRVTGSSQVVKLVIPLWPPKQLAEQGRDALADLAPRHTFTDDLLAELVLALVRHTAGSHQQDRLYRESIEHALFTHLLYRYSGTSPAAVSRRLGYRLSDRQCRLVLDYIHDHLHANLGLDELAHHLGLSVSHFSAQFRNRFGVTPARYLWSMRLDCARELLTTTSLPVGEIAFRCGFTSPSHFAESFRRAYGSAPSAFRNTGRNQDPGNDLEP